MLLALLSALLAPFFVLGMWTHSTLVDQKGFVSALEPLARNPQVQSWVADTLTEQIQADSLVENELERALPDKLGVVTESLAAGVETLVSDASKQLVTSSLFQQAWAKALQQFHPIVAGFVQNNGALSTTREGDVSLDLGPLGAEVLTLVGNTGLSLPASLRPAADTGVVKLFQYRPMAWLQNALKVVNRTRWSLLVAALVCLAAALVFARRRSLALAVAGGTLVVAFAAFEAVLLIERSLLLSKLGGEQDIPLLVGKALWNTLTRGLVTAGIIAVCLGAALLIGG